MKNTSFSTWLPALAAVLFAVAAPLNSLHAVPPPGGTVLPPIDLSPGPDVAAPGSFTLNRSTHRLYVSGGPDVMNGLKVIDTVSNTATGGLTFSPYPDGLFVGSAMTLDESAGPDGNKLYVAGRTPSVVVLRVIDGSSGTEATVAGTDLVLPFALENSYPLRAVVNPTNHKIYISSPNGQIVVVDGPKRLVLTTFNPGAGSFLVVDPVANKVFVLGENGGAVIDSASDTVRPPATPLTLTPNAGLFNERDGRVYLTGYDQQLGAGSLDVLDGKSELLVASRKDNGHYFSSVALVPDEKTIYVGATNKIFAFGTTDLALGGEFNQTGEVLACDPAASGVLYALKLPGYLPTQLQNSVRLIDRATGAVTNVATAYFPGKIAVNNRTNRIYVLDTGTGGFVAINGEDRSVIARVSTPGGLSASDLEVSERLNRIYVAGTDGSGSMLFVFDGTNQKLLDSVRFKGANFIAIDDTRRRIYASRSLGGRYSQYFLDVYDSDTAAFLSSLEVSYGGPAARGTLGVNPVTGRVYFSSQGTQLLSTATTRFSVIDGNGPRILTTADGVKGVPLQFGVNRRTLTTYVPEDNGTIAVVNPATDKTDSVFSAGGDSYGNTLFTGLCVDEGSDELILVDKSSGGTKPASRILVYRGQGDHSLVSEIPIEDAGLGVAFNSVTRQIMVPNAANGTITVVQKTGSTPPNRFANLATRMRVGTGDDALISGLIVTGPAGSTKNVMLRAIGPSLGSRGIADAVPDTTLELHDPAGNVVTNDDWKINDSTHASQQAEIEATGIPPTSDLESAIVADLAPGVYTAVLRGKKGATGVAVAEVYDLDPASSAQLANISTRGNVGTGDDAMIGGVIVTGAGSSPVLVRALGPSLLKTIRNALQNPTLELRDPNGALIEANDDWKNAHETEITATGIPPTDEHESAILASLFPGNYTAVVRGANDTIGVALVEAYRIP